MNHIICSFWHVQHDLERVVNLALIARFIATRAQIFHEQLIFCDTLDGLDEIRLQWMRQLTRRLNALRTE
jgi:hypothetical protein